MIHYPVTASAGYKAVVTAATTFDTVMAAGELYVFSTSTNAFIAQGAAPTASAGDGSMFVHAGERIVLQGDLGAKLSVIRQSVDGAATLTRVRTF